MRKLALILGVSLFCQIGCNPLDSTASDKAVKAEDAARDYPKLELLTPEPVEVNPELAMLCQGATKKEVDESAKRNGPHAHTAIRIFMSRAAAEAFKQNAGAYPVGAVVVKEKKGNPYWAEGSNRKMIKTNDGVGGMIKRARGYDPEHGDWEYFYFEDAKKIESGKIASCVQCHAGAANKDYVFGNWANRVAE